MKPYRPIPLAHPLVADVTVPGSKSYTNRALLMAAMAKGPVTIARPLICDDTLAMVQCLQTLGIHIDTRTDGSIVVAGDIASVADKMYELHVNLSGITARFLTALACVVPGTQIIRGGASLNKRPIGELVDGLRQLGAKISYLEREGFPPLKVASGVLRPGVMHMDGSVSSQYFSALLMVAPAIAGKLTIQVDGEQISKPYIDMTIDTMGQFGVHAANHGYHTYTVDEPQRYHIKHYTVEGDVSSASYFFALAALTGSTVTVNNLNPVSKQADMRFLSVLERMGNTVTGGRDAITATGGRIRPMDIDMQDCPDQAMTMAVLAAFAPGKTTLRGVQSLRVKETERVAAVECELAKMGIRTSSTRDTLTIYGGTPRAAAIDTYGDHRMAMAFAVAGAKLPGMAINHPEVVSKTFPEFWQVLETVLRPANIVLIGMRGSGKSTVGAALAVKLHKQFIDLDEYIAVQAGRAIPDIVAVNGWDYFRQLEAMAVAEVSRMRDVVIATGGGVVLRPENVEALRQRGCLVLLTAAPATLARRIGHDSGRPALTGAATLLEELQEVWQARRSLYEDAADMTISTDRRSPAQITASIARALP